MVKAIAELYDEEAANRRMLFNRTVDVADVVAGIKRNNEERAGRAKAADVSYARQKEIEDDEWCDSEASRLGMTRDEFRRYLWNSWKRR